MKKLYEKNELGFALACIGIYCLLQSLTNPLNEIIGIEYAASAVLCAVQAAFLWRFIRQNGLSRRYGLCKSAVAASRLLYYIPLIVLMTRNFWNGVTLNLSPAGTVCHTLCMLCVGFVEEVIFRGLLFKAMAKNNVNMAVVVSSVTFGLGHVINLFNGSGDGLADNLFQITGAIVIGFVFVILFDRGGSLWPCVIAHAGINITSGFAKAGLTMEKRMIFHVAVIIITVGYALILIKNLPKNGEDT